MKHFTFIKAALSFSALWVVPLQAAITGTVVNEAGAPILDAVVNIKKLPQILPVANTLTNENGIFYFDDYLYITKNPKIHNLKNFTVEILDLNGKVLKKLNVKNSDTLKSDLKNASAKLPQGKYVVNILVDGSPVTLGNFDNKISKTSLQKVSAADVLIIKKAGFLPETLAVEQKNYGQIILKRDPIEAKIDALMSSMSIDEMIAQMTQTLAPSSKCGGYTCGSALNGGGEFYSNFYTTGWSKPIPVMYGKDNVHGLGDFDGATIFPHNIGLGATRDSALVRKIGEAVAKEMWAAHVDLNFAPAVTVPRDERWGRTYEGFGEVPSLAVDLGSAYVRGLQGDNFDAEWRIPATIKHFMGDGGTNNGYDRGNSILSETEIRTIHLPPYIATVEQGAQSVMASFNQINGVHQHVDSLRLTGILKTELGFDGYVIADWEGIENSRTPGEAGDYSGITTGNSSKDAVKQAINAGIDMAMVPNSASKFISAMKSLVASGDISEERVKDAVRRILRVKIRGGRLDNPSGPAAFVGKIANIGSVEHRNLAREAVQKSLVLLKNNDALPLLKSEKVFVTGSHANNAGLQCGGWTQGWQGKSGSITGATTIQAGFDLVASGSRVTSADAADKIVYVIGEGPYAEWYGDYRSADFDDKFYVADSYGGVGRFKTTAQDLSQINQWKTLGKKVTVVLITGRPLPITSLIESADAFVVAWLPGSEGAGVADVLYGVANFTGKLPHTWPASASQIPINEGDGKSGLYPFGYGLSY